MLKLCRKSASTNLVPSAVAGAKSTKATKSASDCGGKSATIESSSVNNCCIANNSSRQFATANNCSIANNSSRQFATFLGLSLVHTFQTIDLVLYPLVYRHCVSCVRVSHSLGRKTSFFGGGDHCLRRECATSDSWKKNSGKIFPRGRCENFLDPLQSCMEEC